MHQARTFLLEKRRGFLANGCPERRKLSQFESIISTFAPGAHIPRYATDWNRAKYNKIQGVSQVFKQSCGENNVSLIDSLLVIPPVLQMTSNDCLKTDETPYMQAYLMRITVFFSLAENLLLLAAFPDPIVSPESK